MICIYYDVVFFFVAIFNNLHIFYIFDGFSETRLSDLS